MDWDLNMQITLKGFETNEFCGGREGASFVIFRLSKMEMNVFHLASTEYNLNWIHDD